MDLIGLTIIITVPCFFIKSFWDLLTGKTKPQERPKKLSKKEQALQERRKELIHDNSNRLINSLSNIDRLYRYSCIKKEAATKLIFQYYDECGELISKGDFEGYEERIPSYPYQ